MVVTTYNFLPIILNVAFTYLAAAFPFTLKSRNPNFKEYVAQKLLANKMVEYLHFKVSVLNDGYVEAEIPFLPHMEQQDGFLHGGVTSTLADMAMGFASYSLVEEGQKVMTVQLSVSYFNRGDAPKIKCIGKVVKAGKRFHFCEAELIGIYDDENSFIIAKATSTMGIIETRSY